MGGTTAIASVPPAISGFSTYPATLWWIGLWVRDCRLIRSTSMESVAPSTLATAPSIRGIFGPLLNKGYRRTNTLGDQRLAPPVANGNGTDSSPLVLLRRPPLNRMVKYSRDSQSSSPPGTFRGWSYVSSGNKDLERKIE